MGRRSQPVGWTSRALGQPGGPCSSGGQSAAAEQLEQVVASADQGPLGVDLLQTPQQELPEAPSLRPCLIWPKTGSTVSIRRA